MIALPPRSGWVEGLLPYLPPPTQDALLNRITELSAPGSTLIIENVDDPQTEADNDFHDQLQQMAEQSRRHGQDLDASALMYSGQRHETARYLKGLGWSTEVVSATDMYEACGRPRAGNQGPFPDVATVFGTLDWIGD